MNRLAVFLTVVVMILSFAGGVALAKVITCTGGPCEGTNQDDEMTGSTTDDTIIAKRGGDTVNSVYGGQDTVLGGRGNDTIDVQELTLPNSSDFVDCGRGKNDTVFEDTDDTAKNCEVTNPPRG